MKSGENQRQLENISISHQAAAKNSK